MSRFYVGLCLLVVAACVGGCGPKRPEGARPTKKVTVTVTYKGAPVENANVTFVNQDGPPAPANGRTNTDGKAKLKTYVEDDGAVVGQHKVLIEKSESVGGSTAAQDSAEYNPNAPPAVTKYLLPKKYSDYGNSGLTAEVKDSGPNEFTFDLKD
jgi:hypothetical protein